MLYEFVLKITVQALLGDVLVVKNGENCSFLQFYLFRVAKPVVDCH